MMLTLTAMFPMGKVKITPEAEDKLTQEDVLEALKRHLRGDWGELDEFDWKVNDDAVECGDRLLSRYQSRRGTWFWIMTEPDRSLTTILLPSNATH